MFKASRGWASLLMAARATSTRLAYRVSWGPCSASHVLVCSLSTDRPKGDMLTVCIVGPPNAGKSTLFNRLLCKESNRSYRLTVDKGQGRRSRQTTRPSQKLVGQSKPANQSGLAIMSATAGTTRDRRECVGRVGGTRFRLWDTAGVEGALTSQQVLHRRKRQPLPTSSVSTSLNGGTSQDDSATDTKLRLDMMTQTVEAARASDLVLLMVDARHAGVTADLLETAKWLRKVSTKSKAMPASHETSQSTHATSVYSKPRILVLANKLEGSSWNMDGSIVMDHLNDIEQKLGFGEPIPISAYHGEGLADIAVEIEQMQRQIMMERGGLDDDQEDAEYDETVPVIKVEKPLQLAILGRQNVGKSTLVNALLGDERVICGATPGLTRDAIAVDWFWRNRPVQLVDTAGIRKRPSRDHSDDVEDMAVQDAMRAMKVADIAVLVLDAEARMLQRQELAIADAILKEGRALVIAANKMDLIVETDYSKEEFVAAVRQQLEGRFPILRNTPIVAMSSLTGEAVNDLMPVVFDARDRWAQKLSTARLNRWLASVLEVKSPPMVNGKPLKIKYMMQTKGRPPTFMLFCSNDQIPESYTRYLVRHFQDSFGMYGMEIRLAIKKSAKVNPFAPSEKAKRSGSGLGGHEARKARKLQSLHQMYKGVNTKEEGRQLQNTKRRKSRKRRTSMF